ncbi:MAG TPA: S-layer homology domain-containing protein, partial [Thermoanaerobaculia bacterium]|nr:S-layer homology domain-containing protein [Thermoanaerobaculia bacterium]
MSRSNGRSFRLGSVLVAFSLITAAAGANDGVLDPTCGTGGKATADLFGSRSDQAVAAAVQADGKIVVAGSVFGPTNDFLLARYNADGTLDASFGSAGIVTTDFAGGDDRATAVAIQTDGKIVAAGWAITGAATRRDFALARYNTDGSLDATFGVGGKVTTDFYQRPDTANAVVIQGDGKIVVGGTTRNSIVHQTQFGLARYNTDGSLDAGFGTGGLVSTTILGLDDEIFSLALQADGKIVAGGYTQISGLNYDFAVARYSGVDGSLDAGFGTGGIVTTDFAGGDDEVAALVIQADGKIVVGGSSLDAGSGYDFALARYSGVDGSLDASFGSGGKVTTDFSGGYDAAGSLVMQPGGSLLVAGVATSGSGNSDFGLARYHVADGSLDATFGTGGKVTTDFSGGLDEATAVLLTASRIVAVGLATNPVTGRDLALARYMSDGTPDSAWGNGGEVTTDTTGSTGNYVFGMATQADGKIVAAGFSSLAGPDFALARFQANGSLDSSFGSGGIVLTDFTGRADAANAVVIQTDGRIVAGGTALAADTSVYFGFALTRYDTNGNLDATFGTGGKVVTSIQPPGADDEVQALALQVDGKIVASGFSIDAVTGTPKFALARYDTSGDLDATFGTGGTLVTSFFGVEDEARAIAIQADQKIVAAGYATNAAPEFALARYNTDGTLDAAFGTGGLVTTSFFGNDDEAFAVAIQPDQKIVVAGYAANAAPEIALARYNSNGSLDATFGSGGLATASILGNDDRALALAIASDGKIVVTGYALGATRQFAVARFKPDGTLDTSFGTGGTSTTSVGGIDDEAHAVTLSADGRITAGGFAVGSTTGPDFAIVRYFVCGFLDVDASSIFREDICTVAQAGITGGCGGGNYCPGSAVTRAQMAVFLLKAEHGSDYVPPKCLGVFPDVPCPSLFADWVEQLAAEG